MTFCHKESNNNGQNNLGIKLENLTQKKNFFLRGGGCGASAHEENLNQKYPLLPNDIAAKLKEYTSIIAEKASLLIDENQKEDALIALQWFHYNEQHFNTLVLNILMLLKASGLLCIEILQICNNLLRIIFSFLIKDRNNKNRYLEETYVEQLKLYANQLENFLKTESSNVWVAGAEFELTMISIALEHCPTNSTKKEELFAQFMNGMFESILQLSPSEQLIKALINLGSEILIDKYNKSFKHKIRKYEIFYFFETLKWTVINQLHFQYSVKLILDSLKDGYNQYVAKSKDWLIHFCWIKVISEILCFRPIIDRNDSKSSEILKQQWNSLIQNKQLIPFSFNASQARVVLKLDNIQNREQSKIFLNINQSTFSLFFRQFIDLETNKGFRLWNDYVEFSFKKKSFEQSLDNLNSINQFLFGNFEIKQLQHQTKLFDEAQNEYMKIHEKILQSFKNYQKEANKSQLLKEIYFDDINFHTNLLKEKLLVMLQLNLLEQFYVRIIAQKLEHFIEILKEHKETMAKNVKDKSKDQHLLKQFKQKIDFNGKLIEDLNQIIVKEVQFQTQKKTFIVQFLELIKLITLVEEESEKIIIFSTFEMKCQTINLKPFIKTHIQNKNLCQEIQNKLIHLQKSYSQFFKQQLNVQKENNTFTCFKAAKMIKDNLAGFVQNNFKDLFTNLKLDIKTVKTVKIFNFSINLEEYQELNFYSCLLFENCNYFRQKMISTYDFIAIMITRISQT